LKGDEIMNTIAAISTPIGHGGIGIVRMSGEKSLEITYKIFKSKHTELQPNTIVYGKIYDKDELVDEVLVSYFKAPFSYTGEDIVEINSHGGILIVERILELILKNGAVLAEPGEFTKRAFLNGRIDLSQAEAVMDLINSKTEISRKSAIKGLNGEKSNKIRKIREKIVELLASIEVNIDYPEYDDAEEITHSVLDKHLKDIREDLTKIVSDSENCRIITNGIKTVIIGKPNVGKSSILNRLLDEDKAIVTDIEGTTRDIVEGTISIDGVLLNIIDTAGIRNTDNIVEKIGVEKSLKAIDKSDLVLFVLDGTRKISKEDLEIFDKVKNKKVIIIVNKSDEDQIIDISKFNKYDIILTSTKLDDGLDELKSKIIEMFNLGNLELNDYTYLSNSRQISILKESLNISEDILKKSEEEIDLLEIDIKILWEKLGEILGETYKDDLLDEIFSKFCLGK
jgi:tRNA modification GTPase